MMMMKTVTREFWARLAAMDDETAMCAPAPPSAELRRTIARPLPAYWPAPSVPRAHATLLPTAAPPWMVEATFAAEEEEWRAHANGKMAAQAVTPPSKKARKAREQRDLANLVGTLCKCGKEDTEKVQGP